MATVTIVTAFNPKNAGMYSVDLAAEQFFGSAGHKVRLVRTQWKQRIGRVRFGRQWFRRLRDPAALFETDVLVYWGDFTTNLLYGREDFPRRDMGFGHATSRNQAFSAWQALFLPIRQNEGTKVLSIGQNFHSLEASLGDLPDAQRSEIENRYRTSFDAILPRDDVSFQSLAPLKLDQAGVRVKVGLDPAMLLDYGALFPTLADVRPTETFAHVFGRSDFGGLSDLLDEVGRRSGCAPVDLPRWHDLDPWFADRQMRKMIETIASARFVLTDTYHCAINALVLGKPVFCLGVRQGAQSSTVSEPKKRILFRMLGLDSNYVELADQALTADRCSMIAKTVVTGLAQRPAHLADRIATFRRDIEAVLAGRT